MACYDVLQFIMESGAKTCKELLRQGVLGIKLKTMLPRDPSGKTGPKKPLPDHMSIVELQNEIPATTNFEQKGEKLESVPQHYGVSLAAGLGVWMLLYKDL
ncbi:40S ribosomal protein S3 [Camelus ferus]|nr:40S ribosomal protein S3 [Camelus ferus]